MTFAPIGPDIDLAEEVANICPRSRNTLLGLMRGMRFSFETDLYNLPSGSLPAFSASICDGLKGASSKSGFSW